MLQLTVIVLMPFVFGETIALCAGFGVTQRVVDCTNNWYLSVVFGVNPCKWAFVFARVVPFFFHEYAATMVLPLVLTVEVNENVSFTQTTAGFVWIEIVNGIESITKMRLIFDN